MADSFEEILIKGITFHRGATEQHDDEKKVKTKARKKKYITGAHGSAAAKQKAKYREKRANRKKK